MLGYAVALLFLFFLLKFPYNEKMEFKSHSLVSYYASTFFEEYFCVTVES